MLRSLLFFFTAAALSAQELSLAEALRRADAHNPALRAQGYAGRATEALIDQAGARPNPTLDLLVENFAGTGAVRGADALETTVQASQTFERGGKRAQRIAVARREHEVAGREFLVFRAEIRAETVAAYVELVAAQQRVALSKDTVALAREIDTAVTARVAAAAGSSAESARTQAALAMARAEHGRVEAGLLRARAALASKWGGPPTDVPMIGNALSIPAELPSSEGLLAKLAEHPRLGLQQAEISSRRASLQLQHAQATQDITVAGGVRFLREGSDAAFVAGVSVPIPFRNQNSGNIRAARETLAGAEQSMRAAEVELRTAFAAAWQDFTAAHAIVQNLRRDALAPTEESLRIVRHAYAQGELSLLEVFDAQRARAALHREILDAETACATALVRLEALTDPTFPLTTTLLTSR